jgi:predicted permease
MEDDRNRELDDEVRSHLEMETERNIERGLSPEDARQAALRLFGSPVLAKERTRESWGSALWDTLAQDVRYGLRTLRRSPGFTTVAVLSLALGIGANTAIFSLIDAVLWKMLPVDRPEQLRLLGTSRQGSTGYTFSYPVYQQLRQANTGFTDLAAFAPVRLNAAVEGQADTDLPAQLVSGNYFSLLGVRPIAGRVFTADDDRVPSGHAVVVISHGYWQRRFALDPAAVGRSLRLNGMLFTILGVAPPEFFGLEVGANPDLFLPLMMQPVAMPAMESWISGNPTNMADWLRVAGRLRPGVEEAQGLAVLRVAYYQAMEERAIRMGKPEAAREMRESRLEFAPGSRGLSDLRRQFSQPLFLLLAVAGLVLLIACANTGNLMLARAAARQREFAIRLAIGAGRGRLIRQLLVESLLLALAAGVGGVWLAWHGSHFLTTFLSVRLNLSPDPRMLGFTLVISLLTGVLFGLTPALRTPGPRLLTPAPRWAAGLVATQIALSLVVLVGAGLFVRSLQKLNAQDGGFRRESVLVARVEPRGSDQKWPNRFRLVTIYNDLLERVERIPGVRVASLAGASPTAPVPLAITLRMLGEDAAVGASLPARAQQIYPHYFASLGVPVLTGRDFSPADMQPNAPNVAIVNETLARRVSVGQRFDWRPGTPAFEIVGVVRDVKYSSLRGETPSVVYMPYLQMPTGRGQMVLHVRVVGDPAALTARLRQEIQAIDPDLPAFEIRSLAGEVDAILIQERLVAGLSTLFGALGLTLAAVGLYGLMSYLVARRTAEIGIRMALGAQRKDVAWLVLRQTLGLVLAGVAIGLPAAVAAARLVSARLFGVTPTDPLALGAAILLLAAIGALAGFIPARRASQVDPMTALRTL